MTTQPEYPRVIIALLPDDHSATFATFLNREIDNSVISFDPETGNSRPHMTVAHINCPDIEGLTSGLDELVGAWCQQDMPTHPIEVDFYTVERFRTTEFIFWNPDPARVALNWNLARFARLLLEGWGGRYAPIKAFAAPEEPAAWMTQAERATLADVGYACAGLWHITVAFVPKDREFEPMPSNGKRVRFPKLVLAHAGRNGTIAEVIKTWDL